MCPRAFSRLSTQKPLKSLTLQKRYHIWYYYFESKIRRGNYTFVTWKGDHSPRHVHIYRDGRLMAKWNLDRGVLMEGRIDRRLRQILGDLVKEGKL